MKFHALALCVAGTLATGIAYAAQNEPAGGRTGEFRMETQRTMDADGRTMYVDEFYAGEQIYVRDVLYPDLPSVQEVARKVAEINEHNRQEAASLRADAAAARQAGWTNVAAVYEHMAMDHVQAGDMTGNWLVAHNFTVPSEPAPEVTLAADTSDPSRSIDHWIDHHAQGFNEAAEKRKTERSSTVRGLLLMQMVTTANHASLLRTLDRDVEIGRKTVSARLESQMNPLYASTRQEEMIARIDEEWRTQFPEVAAPRTGYYVEGAPAPEVIERERIVERVVEVPVERIVERPVTVERIVERPVYVERPVVRSRVAGQRQASPRRRRPAK